MQDYCLFIGWQIRQDILCDIVQPHEDEPENQVKQMIWHNKKVAAMVLAVDKMGHMSIGGEI